MSPSSRDRVLLLLPQPFYEDRGTSIALTHYLRALGDLGQPADVLCFGPGEDIELPGVRIFRAPNPFGFERVPIGLSARKLVLDVFLAHALRRRLARERYLFVHAVEEAVLIARAFAPRRGTLVTYDMQSSLPEQLLQYRGLANRLVQGVAQRVEDRVLRGVDLVVCSEGLEERVRERAPETALLGWRFPASFGPVPAERLARLRKALRIPDRARNDLYVGSFARYQGMEMLARALPRVLAGVPDAVFVAVGAASPRQSSSLAESIGAECAERVRVLDRVDRDDAHAYMALADVLLLPRIHGSNLSLKTFDYLAAGKPIVASDLPLHRWLEREALAVLAPPEPRPFADAVRRTLEDAELADRLRRAARSYADSHLRWPQFTGLVEDLLRYASDRASGARTRSSPDLGA